QIGEAALHRVPRVLRSAARSRRLVRADQGEAVHVRCGSRWETGGEIQRRLLREADHVRGTVEERGGHAVTGEAEVEVLQGWLRRDLPGPGGHLEAIELPRLVRGDPRGEGVADEVSGGETFAQEVARDEETIGLAGDAEPAPFAAEIDLAH